MTARPKSRTAGRPCPSHQRQAASTSTGPSATDRIGRLADPVVLPPYSPDLYPVEGSWAQLKNGPPADLGARTLDEFVTVARRGLRRIQHRPALVNGFVAATSLTQ
ncbi:hypothetical protein [Embleya sp. NPDC059259]|uniref:hypothetical protein n=1 Tax=unclassified Embleya TaxID=2699296 RepID=UPI00367F3F04